MRIFTNKQQAIILGIAGIFGTIGTYLAVFPIATLSPEHRTIIPLAFWICGVATTILKELGGYEAPKETAN